MKNTTKLHGFIALIAIMALFTLGCGDGTGGGGGGGGNLGEELELSGQVYTESYDTNYNISYQSFNGNPTVSDNGAGGTGAITNGQFSYSIGTPTDTTPLNVSNLLTTNSLFEDYENLKATPTGVGCFILGFSITGSSISSGRLSRENFTETETPNSSSSIDESVSYVYVDSDVTITGKGYSDHDSITVEGGTINITYTLKDLNLALKEGWNAIYTKFEISSKLTGTKTATATMTMSATIGNPACRWVLYGYYGGSGSVNMSPSIARSAGALEDANPEVQQQKERLFRLFK